MTGYMYDKFNDFGTLTAAGDFPNIINMGDATAERMTVDLKQPEGNVANTEGVTLALKGSDTETGTYSTIVESGVVTADMIGEGYSLPIPKTNYKFLKVGIAGSFEGKVQAIINSYLGK